MRKKILFLTIFVAFFLVGATIVWAIPPGSSPRNPWDSPPFKPPALQFSNEATEEGRILNPRESRATPPGLLRLRQRLATPPSAASLRRHVYHGTISAILSSSRAFTLSTANGPKTVQTNEETKFIKGKLKDGVKASFENLKVGDRVVAVGRVSDEGLMTAKIVIIFPTKEQIKRRAVYGVVEQKVATDSATLLTLRHPKTSRTYEVVVNSLTKITGKGLVNPTAVNIQVGDRVTAVGTVDEAGRITAKRLHIIPGLARGLFGTQPGSPSSKPATPPGWLKRPTATPTPTP